MRGLAVSRSLYFVKKYHFCPDFLTILRRDWHRGGEVILGSVIL